MQSFRQVRIYAHLQIGRHKWRPNNAMAHYFHTSIFATNRSLPLPSSSV